MVQSRVMFYLRGLATTKLIGRFNLSVLTWIAERATRSGADIKADSTSGCFAMPRPLLVVPPFAKIQQRGLAKTAFLFLACDGLYCGHAIRLALHDAAQDGKRTRVGRVHAQIRQRARAEVLPFGQRRIRRRGSRTREKRSA